MPTANSQQPTAPSQQPQKRIGIFGGSFNPIHCGHVALARQLLTAAGLDEVWLMVSPQNPLKRQDGLLDDALRLEMARLAVADEPRIHASDYEFRLPRPSYTWHTLQCLQADYPDTSFTLLIGGDNWAHFDRWYRAEELISRYRMVVYPRPGSDIDATQLPPNVTLVEAQLMDISSTDIRRRIRRGESVDTLVPAAVARLIREHQLYR